MKIIAIDPGTKTGWCTNVYGFVEIGEEDFSLDRSESRGMRFLRFRRWLKDAARDAELIAYEMAHMRGGAATEVLMGFTTRIQEFCAEKNIEHFAVHSATLKKFALGVGRGSKEEMIVKAREGLYGQTSCSGSINLTDNMADAYHLLMYSKQRFE